MFPRASLIASVFAASLFASASGASTIAPADLAKEINLATSAATAVIAGLQADINGAKLPATAAAPDVLRQAYFAQFEKLAGSPFAQAPDAARGEIRKAFGEAFDEVVGKFREDMIRGGQDAFVPAFFRAQLLLAFNARVGGKYRAVVTMRQNELINRDSAPERVIEDKRVVAYVKDLLERGEMNPQSQAIEGRFVSYWPMKIAEPCAVCHQRNGLEQQVGGFGGATIVMVEANR